MSHLFNKTYSGENLNKIAFPLGGMGAGMVCLEGSGCLSHVSVRHKPEVWNAPLIFAALHVKGTTPVSRILEGRVPDWKVMFPWGKYHEGAGGGGRDKTFGLPRFRRNECLFQFPFATVSLADDAVPVRAEITGWSPFIPGDADASSLPVARLEYRLTNTGTADLDTVFSFHSKNFLRVDGSGGKAGVATQQNGFTLFQEGTEEAPWHQSHLRIWSDAPDTAVNGRWFRGGWWDSITMVWKSVEQGAIIHQPSEDSDEGLPGGSLYIPVSLKPGESRTIPLDLAWFTPQSDVSCGYGNEMCDFDGTKRCVPATPRHIPWYARRFADIDAVQAYWDASKDALRDRSLRFRDTLYGTTLPDEVIEAIGANLSILKSPTVLRQHDGRLWGWEGCCDDVGCCHGSCTHVWNYAQALPHLFPELERTLRETEHFETQDENGHQNFRSHLPIRRLQGEEHHRGYAAADGQLGGILKAYRDWRIGGDTAWLRKLWPALKQSLDFCQRTWDPGRKGYLVEPHHNTYDIEFWGADGMCTSFYLGALKAAMLMCEEIGEDKASYEALYREGREFMESQLFNGEFFIQKVQWQGLQAPSPLETSAKGISLNYTPEARELMNREGPKYQYGEGCLSDGVLGAWMAEVCGVGEILDPAKVESHLLAVHRYNYRSDLSAHANPQRPTYALNDEAGLLLCSWPNGGKPSLPFVYSDEVWTGFEYQVASHLMRFGHVEQGLEIVRAARSRYDGCVRNPLNEYECGHWYARALSSYALLQGLTGIRYDKPTRTLHIRPAIQGDFVSFLATEGGYGLAGIRNGIPFVDVREGTIEVAAMDCISANERQ